LRVGDGDAAGSGRNVPALGILMRNRETQDQNPGSKELPVNFPLRLIAIFFLAASLVTPAFAQSGGKALYTANCALCHGATGLGDTPAGKALKAASFKDPAVIKVPDAERFTAVKDGKGKMPPNPGKLTDAQIKAALAYIRTLQK
jgi:cytochrome c6